MTTPPPVTRESYPAIRRRLVRELHRRAYHDAGVEIHPCGRDDEPSSAYRIGTPHCQQGDRELGALQWGDELSLALSARAFGSWDELRREAFDRLAVARWRTQYHKGCFHRRGKARYDLIFAVACELAAAAPARAAAHLSVLDDDADSHRAAREIVTAFGEPPLPGKPPRHLVVTCCDATVAVLRGDGWAATATGALALDDLWWRGFQPAGLATALGRRTAHRHASQTPNPGDATATLAPDQE